MRNTLQYQSRCGHRGLSDIRGLLYGGRRIYSAGGMRGKRAMVTVTLGGREHMFGPDAIHGELEDMFRPLLQGTFVYRGFEVLP